jgi:predicted dehydrogenase
MKKCRVAVIGTGGIADGIHMPVLSRLPNAEIVAVCDKITERAEKAAEKFGVPANKAYSVYGEMLNKERDNIDAVFVLTEPDALFRIAADCLNAGRHAFIEKPMGITAFQANSLRECAVKNKKILHTGYNRRYIPLVAEIVSQMRKLTEINQISGYFYKNSSASFYGGCAGSFICDVIHVIDLVRYIAGGENKNKLSVSRASTLETADPETGVASAWHSAMRFESGAHKIDAVIGANYNAGGRVHRFELHGKGASAYINLGFGDAGCDGRILCDGASFSIVSAGAGNKKILEFDGRKIAGSERYEDYYGYRDEDILFINKVLEDPAETDISRLNEDYDSVLLAEMLLDGRI